MCTHCEVGIMLTNKIQNCSLSISQVTWITSFRKHLMITYSNIFLCHSVITRIQLEIMKNIALKSSHVMFESHYEEHPFATLEFMVSFLSFWVHLSLEPCPKVVPRYLQNHVVWSWTLKCSVKSCVIGSSTKCHFNEWLFMEALTHDKIK